MNAEAVIQKLKSIGYQIRTDGQDILLSADHDPDPEQATILLADLKQCKAEAVRLLQGKSEAWPAEIKTLIDWFLISPTPEAPFQLNSCTRVVNSELFYAVLRREIESGPRGTRARHGALQNDLRDLQAKLN
jgi:hypothetical protein